MVRLVAEHASKQWGSIPLAIGLFVAVSALVALCAKHTRRAPPKFEEDAIDTKLAPKSPCLLKPKQLVTNIGNKAKPFICKKGKQPGNGGLEEGGFGGGGLWQKAILMGEKCRPPEFAGVIYYDSYGNQVSEPPQRSPGASPLLRFSLPVAKLTS
ncbi:uncharacterized protein LOC111317648 [Durio zibethinus]|uniref:Uncharacterized protein LOC111317648 n=1 Tax=Durio zibethinus TaxID=66656 RepID=A0A6P6BFH8_DURZI|nr:uncharacterized protein LOC111317648 [Durio zibethinus]